MRTTHFLWRPAQSKLPRRPRDAQPGVWSEPRAPMQLVSGALDSLRPRVKLLDSRLPNRSKCGEAVSRTNRQNIVWNCCFLYSAGFLVFGLWQKKKKSKKRKDVQPKKLRITSSVALHSNFCELLNSPSGCHRETSLMGCHQLPFFATGSQQAAEPRNSFV